MSTDLHQRPVGRLDRLVAWILDPDGVAFGDERERLRYYESSTVVASLHGVLVPWALVACALLGGQAVAPVVIAIAVVFVLPLLVGSAYVRRRRVRTTPARVSPTFVVTAVLCWMPYPVLLLVVAAQFASSSGHGFARGFLYGGIGGAVIGAIAGLIGFVHQHRAEHRQAPAEDDE